MPAPIISLYLVREIISLEKLTIPAYQRPYTWKVKHTLQLLDDIQESSNTQLATYRIGTVILHLDADLKLNIVDGQQRLTTLTLILDALGEQGMTLLSAEYSHELSRQNLFDNLKAVHEWLSGLGEKARHQFKDYLREHCEFVTIRIDELAEAFQFFDSQNSRGKPLDPPDLLKAFHLREMRADTEAEKLSCVVKWEAAIDQQILNSIIGTYLFRIRKWSRGDHAGQFTGEDIAEFKGINFQQQPAYPYLRPYLMNDALINQWSADPLWLSMGNPASYPFQITQVILNGRRFFEMIHYYAQMHEQLFDGTVSRPFQEFFEKNTCYPGSSKNGDQYVKRMYKAIILLYFDRFGLEGFDAAYVFLYMWAYKLRMEKFSVRYLSINSYVHSSLDNLFQIISSTYHHPEILNIRHTLHLDTESLKRPIPEVVDVFKKHHLA
jgi:hypothetical protein